MSEEHTISPIPAPPKRRRRWIMAILVTLTTYGGTYWWLDRLTPDEQVFVGRWELFFDPSVNTNSVVLEYRGNRTLLSISGKLLYWSANEGRIIYQEDRPVHKRVSELFEMMRGRGGFPLQLVDHYEIVNRDKIIISRIEAPSKTVAILQRIVEIRPQDRP